MKTITLLIIACSITLAACSGQTVVPLGQAQVGVASQIRLPTIATPQSTAKPVPTATPTPLSKPDCQRIIDALSQVVHITRVLQGTVAKSYSIDGQADMEKAIFAVTDEGKKLTVTPSKLIDVIRRQCKSWFGIGADGRTIHIVDPN